MTGPTAQLAEARVPVESDADIVTARMHGRELARRLGFPVVTTTLIATAISELARNILQYARSGEILITPTECNGVVGLSVVARDEGPGIADVERAMRDGFSTSGRLGLGLPGVKRLMDQFEIVSHAERGTTIVVKKWLD